MSLLSLKAKVSRNPSRPGTPSRSNELKDCQFLTAYAPKILEACLAQKPPVTERDGFFKHVCDHGGNTYSKTHLQGQVYDFLNGEILLHKSHVAIATLSVIHQAFKIPFTEENFADALKELRRRYPEGNHHVLKYFSFGKSADAMTRPDDSTKPSDEKPTTAKEITHIKQPLMRSGMKVAAQDKWNPILITVTEQIKSFKSKQNYPDSWSAAPDDVGKHLLQLIRQMMSEGIVTMVGVPDRERRDFCDRVLGESASATLNFSGKRGRQTQGNMSAVVALNALFILDTGGRLVPGSKTPYFNYGRFSSGTLDL